MLVLFLKKRKKYNLFLYKSREKEKEKRTDKHMSWIFMLFPNTIFLRIPILRKSKNRIYPIVGEVSFKKVELSFFFCVYMWDFRDA